MMSSFRKKHKKKREGNSLISLSTARESASLGFTGNLIKCRHGKYAPSRALFILNLTTLIQSALCVLTHKLCGSEMKFLLTSLNSHTHTISLAKLKIISLLLYMHVYMCHFFWDKTLSFLSAQACTKKNCKPKIVSR
jgi:hypothetical protein